MAAPLARDQDGVIGGHELLERKVLAHLHQFFCHGRFILQNAISPSFFTSVTSHACGLYARLITEGQRRYQRNLEGVVAPGI